MRVMTAFNASAMGVETESLVSTLESDAGIAYAKATNDSTPAHLDGSFIPPVYGVVPVWDKVFEVVNNVVPQEHFFSVVHGEQDMIFHTPLVAGLTLRSSATGESISVKDSGTTLVVAAQSFNDDTNELVLEQYFTMFFRGVNGGDNFGTPHATGLDVARYKQLISGAPIASVDSHMDDDQTFRYADASGDRMPIHLDDAFAQAVGLGGIIIHGLCTMANASAAAIGSVCDNDPARLKRIAVRFSRPLRPGDDLRSIFVQGENANIYLFQSTRVADGEIILTNAFVEVTS